MLAAEDYDLWLRILIDHEAGLLDEPLVTRRGGHPDQTSATTPAIDRFRILALAKLLADDRLSPMRRAAVIEVLAEKCRIYAGGLARRGRIDQARLYESIADQAQVGAPAEIGCAIKSIDRRFTKFHMNADEIDAQIRELAAERRVPSSHLERWLDMDPESRAAMLDIALALRLRTGQLVTALEMVEEISVRDHITSPRFSTNRKFGGSRTARVLLHRVRGRCWKRCERFAIPLKENAGTVALRSLGAEASPWNFDRLAQRTWL